MRRAYFLIAWITLSIGCGEGDGSTNDGGRRMDAAGDASASSCVEVLACVGACGSEACIDGCLAHATPDAAAQITALVSCNAAAGCGDDDACIEANCGEEVAACQGIVLGDGGVVFTDGGDDASTTMPSRIVGTSRDYGTFPGSTFTVDSNATVTFVRDDGAGEAAGVPSSMFAFYRLESVTYRAVAGGVNGICEMSADFTETFTNPPAFENHIMVEREAGTDGLRGYAITTTLTVNHPMGMMVTCPPPIPSTPGEFNAEHNLTTGTSMPRSDGMTFVGTTMIGSRTFSWDLSAQD